MEWKYNRSWWLHLQIPPVSLLDTNGSLSLVSDLVGDEEETQDEEMEAAAQHLTEEIINQVLPNLEQGPQGGTEAQEQGKEAAELPSDSTRVPLTLLLGPFPSAASLGLTDSIRQCLSDEGEDGEWLLYQCPSCGSFLLLCSLIIIFFF